MSTYHYYFYYYFIHIYLYLYLKTITLNLSILHNFIHILHIYFNEFYTCTSLMYIQCWSLVEKILIGKSWRIRILGQKPVPVPLSPQNPNKNWPGFHPGLRCVISVTYTVYMWTECVGFMCFCIMSLWGWRLTAEICRGVTYVCD